jgi:tetratricopeptide (TPR) repeat protein
MVASDNYSNKLAIILIIFLTALVYANSLKNNFVLDDTWIIVNNNFVKSWKNISQLFSRDYLTSPQDVSLVGVRDIGSGELTYRPIVTLSYFIDYSLWQSNPFGYHLTNLLLHIFNCLLFYFFISLILGNKKIALFSSLLFALHPVNSETVNAIAFRDDLLVFLFFVSSFILFIKSEKNIERKKIYFYLISVIFFMLALFSKEMAITLPVLLMLYDYFFTFNRKIRDLFINSKYRYLGYIFVCFFYLWVWGFVMGNKNYPERYIGGNFYINLLAVFVIITTYYMRWVFMPLGIHGILHHEPSFILHSFPLRLSIAIIIIILFLLAVKLYRKSKEILFSSFWFFVTLLPASNLFPLHNKITYRYLYIPIAGLCLFISLFLFKPPQSLSSRFSPEALKKISRNVIIIILSFYSITTVIRNLAWRNNINLWTELTEVYPNSAFAHGGLGLQFQKAGLPDKAINEYKIAIRLNPNSAEYHNGLALSYYLKDMLDEAIKEYKVAILLSSASPGIYSNLGFAYKDKGLYKEAIACFEHAVTLDSKYTLAYDGLGDVYEKIGNLNEAKKAWETALRIFPSESHALNKLKTLFRENKR